MLSQKEKQSLAGLTKHDCPAACNIDGCVIANGYPHCMHPLKGAIPDRWFGDAEIHRIFNDACIALGVNNIYGTNAGGET